jgi:hypothetical protein
MHGSILGGLISFLNQQALQQNLIHAAPKSLLSVDKHDRNDPTVLLDERRI